MRTVIIILTIATLSSCQQKSNQAENVSTSVHCDTASIIAWYKAQKPIIKNHLTSDTEVKILYTMNPTLLQGGTVSAVNAVSQVNSYINLITPDEEEFTIRSFFVNAGILRRYLLGDKTKQIVNFKLCFAYDTLFAQGKSANPITELVIAGVDKNGNYVLTPQGGFYDQIAGCPAVCPNSGESQYDDFILTQGTVGRVMFPTVRPNVVK